MLARSWIVKDFAATGNEQFYSGLTANSAAGDGQEADCRSDTMINLSQCFWM